MRGTVHEVLVLDTRTQRGYPTCRELDALPQLLSPLAFEQQLLPLLEAADQEVRQANALPPIQLTLVVAPTNLFSIKILDQLQSLGHRLGKGFDIDIGDSWTLENATRAKFLAHLMKARKSIVVLSGDIHFAGTIHLDYWSRHWQSDNFSPIYQPSRKPRYLNIPAVRKHTLVQCTASAICNSEPLTEILHTRLKSLFPERARRWIGWKNADEVEIGFGVHATLARIASSPFLLTGKLHQLLRHSIQSPSAPTTPPDWQYESYWVKRQPATIPAWGMAPPWVSRQDHSVKVRRKGWLQRLWNTRWLQEGKEVIGFNNIGLVRLEHSTPEQSKPNQCPDMIIHEVYWYAPWSDTPHVVCSQYRTNLLSSPFQDVSSDPAAALMMPPQSQVEHGESAP